MLLEFIPVRDHLLWYFKINDDVSASKGDIVASSASLETGWAIVWRCPGVTLRTVFLTFDSVGCVWIWSQREYVRRVSSGDPLVLLLIVRLLWRVKKSESCFTLVASPTSIDTITASCSLKVTWSTCVVTERIRVSLGGTSTNFYWKKSSWMSSKNWRRKRCSTG